jgi:PncC family amidohydrolase
MSGHDEVSRLATVLREQQSRVVFAESCTAGLVSALLAAIPGISEYLCGSLVTYREDSKRQWLSIPSEMLNQYTAVSANVTERMAIEALGRTPEANLAGAVTGHLGPNAPPEMDGLCFVAIARREDERCLVVHQSSRRLKAQGRVERQHEAAQFLLERVAATLRPGEPI